VRPLAFVSWPFFTSEYFDGVTATELGIVNVTVLSHNDLVLPATNGVHPEQAPRSIWDTPVHRVANVFFALLRTTSAGVATFVLVDLLVGSPRARCLPRIRAESADVLLYLVRLADELQFDQPSARRRAPASVTDGVRAVFGAIAADTVAAPRSPF
jgi:hypothetical protein